MRPFKLLRTCFLAAALQVGIVTGVSPAQPKNSSVEDVKTRGYAEIVVDAKTGEVLLEKNSGQRLYPASTTKLLTIYLTFEALKNGTLTLGQKLKISPYAAGQERTNLSLSSKQTITVENAIKGMLVHSANDAAVVLAETVGGSVSGFVRMMNETAQKLGMNDSYFTNPNGLPDPKQATTVEDMTMLARAILQNFPEYYPYFSLKTFTFKGTTYKNFNTLLGTYPGVDGMKTGYINDSGYNLVCSAEKDSNRVIAVIFGSVSAKNRTLSMTRMLDSAFNKLSKPPEMEKERKLIFMVQPPSLPPFLQEQDSSSTSFKISAKISAHSRRQMRWNAKTHYNFI